MTVSHAGPGTVHRHHGMPFGADCVGQGTVRFRLWAPALSEVTLHLGNRPPLALRAAGDGWFERVCERVPIGSRYCYEVGDGLCVPDPASRANPDGVHGPSRVVDAGAFPWRDGGWRGRPWHEAVIYELHVGTFSPEGSFAGVTQRLDHLLELGITAIELMPLAQFPGQRNWGYDGALPFAPHADYGSPDDLKRLIQTAHQRGLMVLLDVVYNHFGPEGNYLHHYAPSFFSERHHTPWGAAINFDGEMSRTVRDFYIHNALYWLEEFHFDGLRLDAVHAILDDSQPDILQELARVVRDTLGRERHIHLVLENDRNSARYLEQDGPDHLYDAQWNDDLHHACHVLLTGERDGYYADYAEQTAARLGRCLSEGFAYQGERSHYRHGERRGEPSAHLPPTAFVAFLQNHDQIGNRAFGERLVTLARPEALATATALLLLAPAPPLLFMGEEWGARQPFPFFCQFEAGLAEAVTEGRRREFARFPRFHDPATRARIPDPCTESTFRLARLDWSAAQRQPQRAWLERYRRLLALRRQVIVPRLPGAHGSWFEVLGAAALEVSWRLGDGSRLTVLVNLGEATVTLAGPPRGRLLIAEPEAREAELAAGRLPACSLGWYLEAADGAG